MVEDIEGMIPNVRELGIREVGVQTSPPRCAEEAVVQSPDVRCCPQPVPVDGFDEGGDGVRDGKVGDGEMRDGAFVTLTSSLPNTPNDADTEAGPKLVESRVVAWAVGSPLADVVGQQDGSCAWGGG